MQIHVNGKLVSEEQAMVSAQDAGMQHAVGLFETMHARHGRVFRLDRHLQRLGSSAAALGLARQVDPMALTQAIRETLDANDLREARVRLTLTPGPVSMMPGRPNLDEQPPTIIVVATPPTAYDPAYFEKGIRVIVAPQMLSPFDPTCGYKTLNYWSRLFMLRQAASAGCGEVLYLSFTNHLASGAISNVFLVKDGILRTPIARGEETDGSLPAPVLPGITRGAILDLAGRDGIETQTTMLSIEDILDADEIFLTNSGWHVLPVTGVEKKAVGDGNVGPVTRQLRQALLDLIDRDTTD